MCEINVGFKDERLCLLFLHAPGQCTIHREMERLGTVRALALNPDNQLLVT